MVTSYFPEQSVINRLKNQVRADENQIEWPNVIVKAAYKKYEKKIPESSFTLFTNLNGKTRLNHHHKVLEVCEQTFYLSNPFERFDYEIDAESEVNTFNIHFNFSFYSKALYALVNSHENLLDNPLESNVNYTFINQLHFKSAIISGHLKNYNPEDEADFLLELLSHCLYLDQQDKKRINHIPAAKSNTQKELFKRMQVVKDYLFSNFSNPDLSLTELSRLVMMSHFHFLRTFKQVYGITPYQFLKKIRLERAKHLISKTELPIQDIAYAVGFKEPSAIYPIIKSNVMMTPQNYRKKK